MPASTYVTSDQLTTALENITDTLAMLSCDEGEVPKSINGAWACQPDNSSDTLGNLACPADGVVKWNGAAWACGTDTDTTLSATDILQIVSDAGYVPLSDLAEVAYSGNYSDLKNVPAALQLLSADSSGDLAYNGNSVISSTGQWVGDIAGLQGIPGNDGSPGKNGEDGKDGAPGQNGDDGKDGLDGAPGQNGKDGINGADGKDGKAGQDGQDGQDGVGLGRPCVTLLTPNKTDEQKYVLSLLVDGKNICDGPHGCDILAYGIYDSDHANSGKPSHMRPSGHYVEGSANNWVYDDDEEAETRGKNGDATSVKIAGVTSDTDCRLLDDYSGVSTKSYEFVVQDSDANERCRVSVCARDW